MSSFARRSTPRGYTLLELLIVLAVMVVVASLAMPSLGRSFEKSKLRNAAKQLRVALARARIEAIDSGGAQRFRYQPGTGVFEIAPLSTAADGDAGGGFTPVAPEELGGDLSLAAGVPESEAARYELPEGVRFLDPALPDASLAEPDPLAADVSTVSPASDVPASAADWSAPIVFYPNGRTFNARVRLRSTDYYVDVTLRGLTGASTVGDVERIERPLDQSEPSGGTSESSGNSQEPIKKSPGPLPEKIP
jgi:prepilin-type N-terminal cleavage/methylation domain-containing protein